MESCKLICTLFISFILLVCYEVDAYPEGAISAGILQQMLWEIQVSTSIFPNDKNSSTYVLMVDEARTNCITIKDSSPGNGVPVMFQPCQFNDSEESDSSQQFFMHFADRGYFSLSTTLEACIGGGYDDEAYVFTGDICDSPTHQFAMVKHGTAAAGIAVFVHRETGMCLSTNCSSGRLCIQTCAYSTSAYQRWRLCNNAGDLCWPSNIPLTL